MDLQGQSSVEFEPIYIFFRKMHCKMSVAKCQPFCSGLNVLTFWCWSRNRAQSRNTPSQWEALLHCNNVSHWPGAYLDDPCMNISKRTRRSIGSNDNSSTHYWPPGTYFVKNTYNWVWCFKYHKRNIAKDVPMNNYKVPNIQACSFHVVWNRGCTQYLVVNCKYWVDSLVSTRVSGYSEVILFYGCWYPAFLCRQVFNSHVIE